MPNAIISHQAPALFIKIKFPNRIDGTAICIGALVPDLCVIPELLFPIYLRDISHSLLGLLIWTAPLTFLLTMLFCRYIGPFISNFAKKNRFLSKPLQFFGVDNWDILKKKVFNRHFFIVAFYSALIGGLTHLILDLPSHGYVELFYPHILRVPDILWISLIDLGTISIGVWQFNAVIRVYSIIWFIEDFILLIISLYLLRIIKKRDLIRSWDKTLLK
jgi:hypothetical protein